MGFRRWVFVDGFSCCDQKDREHELSGRASIGLVQLGTCGVAIMPMRQFGFLSSQGIDRTRSLCLATACITMMIGALSAGAGCQKTALRPDDTRSQFDRYDQARNQRAQPFLEDEFGRRTPNLAERLLIRGE